MLSNEVAVLVDIQNIYYGALNYGEGYGKIDYEKLRNVLEFEVGGRLTKWGGVLSDCLIPFDASFTWYGYVVQTPRYNGIGLFAMLRRLGYNLRVQQYPSDLNENSEWKGGVAAQMQMDYVQQCPTQAAMVVVSGNGALAPVFDASRRNWPGVRRILVSFEHTLHSTYEDREDIIDDIIYLGDNVLR